MDRVDVFTGSNANQVPSHCGNLPNDVLSAIFNMCADLDPPHQTYSTGSIVHHLGWIILGHVNWRWRTLLLSLSPLWADVVCVFPMVAREMITRARHAPLSFHIPYLEDENVEGDLVRLALSKISQIRSLRMGSWHSPMESKYRQDVTAALTQWPLPLLEEVYLQIDSHPYPTGIPEILPSSPATGQLDTSLRLHAPALRAYAHCDLFKFACPMLTSLKTTDIIDTGSSPQDIFSMLRGFPLLETLHLNLHYSPNSRSRDALVPIATQRADPWAAGVGQPVVLQHLHSATFDADSPDVDVLGLWGCIQAPGNCDVLLSGIDLVATIGPAYRALEPQLQDPALDTFVVECPGRFGVGVEVALQSSRSTVNATSGQYVTLSSGRCNMDHSQTPAIVSSFISAAQTQVIRFLELLDMGNRRSYYYNDEMRRALEPLSSVEVVSVHEGIGTGVLCMMDAPENGPEPLFPKLDTLIINMGTTTYEFENWRSDYWRTLAELLDHRKCAGVPVRELRITGEWISQEVLQDDLEAPHLAKARMAVEVVRDERILRYHGKGWGCCATGVQGESDDESEET